MNSRERVLNSLDRRGYDRIPVKHEGTPEVNLELMSHFGVENHDELLDRLGDDFRYIQAEWCGPELRTFADGSREGWWGERYGNISFGDGSYPEAVYLPFADITDVGQLAEFRSPSPDDLDFNSIPNQCERYNAFAEVFGSAGFFDFINGIARCRGVEQVLIDIALEDPVYVRLVEQRYEFFMGVIERALRAAAGRIDFVHVGEDLGTQNGLLISPRKFERLFAAKYRAVFDLAHRYGARAIMHSCGGVRRLIPRLIDLGLDVLDVVQVGAQGMKLHELHAAYGGDLAFCGTVDVQTTLPFGTVEDVQREVELRLELFENGGLFLGPTHAIQVGTPLDNTLAMYRAAGSLEMCGE